MATSAITRIDEQIAEYKSALLDLYAQRNSHSFISRLPPEILATIFIHCARDYQSEDGSHSGIIVPNWVAVSYVCSYWRSVALNCTTLWSYLTLTLPRWTEELLARSKQVPLKLHVDNMTHLSDICSRSPLRLVMNHVERIQELHLACSNLMGYSRLLDTLTTPARPAPRLQNLKVSAIETYPWETWDTLPFDNGNTPSLRTLELSCCPIPWYRFKLSCLTTLSLHCIPARSRQNMEEFLSTLIFMQNLKHLYIERSLASAIGFLSSGTFHTFQKITLARLSRLLVVDSLSTIIAFLSCVTIPSKTQVRLNCRGERGASQDDYDLFSSLIAQSFGMSCSTFRSLVILASTWSEMVLRFSALERHCGSADSSYVSSYREDHWDRDIPLQIMLNPHSKGMRHDLDNAHIINDICCSLPLTNVQSIHITNPPSSSAFWNKLLGHLQGLRHLKLSGGWIPDIAPVLSLVPRGYMENQGGHTDLRGPDQMLVPALVELELCELCLQVRERPSQRGTNIADVQSLYDALSSRKGSRGQLTMTDCFGPCSHSNAVGRWEEGHFQLEVVEE